MKRIGLFGVMFGVAALAICDSADARHHHRRRGCGGCGDGYYDAGYGSPVQKGAYDSPVQKGGYGTPSPSDGGTPAPPAPPPPPTPRAT